MADKGLVEAEGRYRSLFEEAPISLWEEDFTEVRKYLDQLRAGGVEDLRGYFKDNPEALGECASKVKVLDVNKCTLEQYGARSKQEFFDNLSRFFCDETYPFVMEEVLAIAKGEVAFEGETVNKTLQGGTLYIYLKWIVPPGNREKYSRVIVSIMDITERKQAEEALAGREEHFRLLIENALDLITVLGADGTVAYIGPSVKRALGYEPDELAGKNVFDFIHPDDVQRSIKALEASAHVQGVTEHLELRVRHKDGSWRLHEASSNNLLDNPVVQGIVINSRDITERKRAEDSLKESELMLRRILDNMTDMVNQTDTQGIFTYITPSYLSILGYQREELIGHSVFELIHPDDLEGVVDAFVKAGESLQPDKVEYRYRHADGNYLWLETSGNPLFDEAGELIGAIFTTRDVTGRRLAEDALRESEEKFRALTDQSLMGIAILQGDVLVYINQALADICEYSIEEIMAWGPEEFAKAVHPDDLPRVMEQVRRKQAGESGAIPSYEWRLVTKSGESKWIESYSKTISLKGSPADLVTITDITERVKTEESLRESEERYRMLFHRSPVGVFYYDTELQLTDCNERFIAELQSSRELLVGLDLNALRDQGVLPAIRRALKGEEGTFEDLYRATTSEAEIRVSMRTAALYDREGNVTGGVGIVEDVTERVKAEESLRESEERYRAVFEATGTAMCVIDAGGYIVFTNLEFLRLSGYRAEEMEAGMPLGDLLTDGGAEEAMRCLRELECGQSELRRHLSLRLKCAGGGGKEVLASMGLLPGREAIVLSLIDVTREREYERELEKRARQLSDFLGIASHELRHPITLIRGYAQTLLEAWKEGRVEVVEEIATVVEASSRRLTHLVEELLDVSRIEEGRFLVEKRKARLEPLVREAAAEMGERCAERDFVVLIGEEGHPLLLDLERVRQLMIILLENAANFSRPGTAVEVEVERVGDEAMVSVLDRGVGVPAGEEKKIFERFYQVEDLTHHSTPGLGIGLFIANTIVGAHGGRVWCEPRPGGGSIFRFTLPIQ